MKYLGVLLAGLAAALVLTPVALTGGSHCVPSHPEHCHPTAVTVTSLAASTSTAGTLISWQTANKVGVAGFNVYAGSFRVNKRLLPAGTSRFFTRIIAARYSLEMVSLTGAKSTVGTVRRG